MQEELRENPNAYFMTLTIDDKSYKELKKAVEDKTDNGIATIAIRRMLERIRKQCECTMATSNAHDKHESFLSKICTKSIG